MRRGRPSFSSCAVPPVPVLLSSPPPARPPGLLPQCRASSCPPHPSSRNAPLSAAPVLVGRAHPDALRPSPSRPSSLRPSPACTRPSVHYVPSCCRSHPVTAHAQVRRSPSIDIAASSSLPSSMLLELTPKQQARVDKVTHCYSVPVRLVCQNQVALILILQVPSFRSDGISPYCSIRKKQRKKIENHLNFVKKNLILGTF